MIPHKIEKVNENCGFFRRGVLQYRRHFYKKRGGESNEKTDFVECERPARVRREKL